MFGLGLGNVSMGSGMQAPLVVNDWFQFTFDTRIVGASPSDTIFFRFKAGSVLTVDKMDGSDLIYIDTVTAILEFQYATEGIHSIRFKGYGFLQQQGTLDRNKLISLDNCGTFIHTNGDSMLNGCDNLVNNSTDQMIFTTTTPLRLTFKLCPKINTIPKINTSFFISFLQTVRDSNFNQNVGYFDLRNCTSMTDFAYGVTTWSTENYGNTLLGWLRWDATTHAPAIGWVLKSNVSFHGGNSTIAIGSEAALAHAYLTDVLFWTITDGGIV